MKVLTQLGSAGAKLAMTAVATTALAATAVVTAGALAGPASAAATPNWLRTGAARAVFVQTDNTAGNAVVAYHRAAGGSLTLAGSYPTGGRGGQQFTNTPGQVAFSPDGSQLIVTTKANGDDIDVFGVRFDGTLSGQPVVNSEPGTVPFAIAFDPAGHLVIADAGTNALSTFALSPGGTVTLIDAVGTGQSATCWVAPDGGLLFASNAGSATVSRYASSAGGQLTLLGQTATDPGTRRSVFRPAGC
jgi:DNA-binding beta-propeller fold protein YncE